MSRTIQVLPDLVANQIAAGEVVESPASVVKELVENALDARATRVKVQVRSGGKRFISVTDNGSGMCREDSLLCMDRHATSKIKLADDLRSISTFGFRGEALSSIVAISRVKLWTKINTEDTGNLIKAAGGVITGFEDIARQRGTTVEVANLFYNAPARKKFLKASSAETRAVSEVIHMYALANPLVAFSLRSDNRMLLDISPARDISSRIASLWGAPVAEELISVTSASGGVQMQGLIQRPEYVKKGFRRAHLFVNGRPFRSSQLKSAVDRGYRTTIAESVKGWFFIYLNLPPELIDPNVHPTKAEVRFDGSCKVDELIENGIRSALSSVESAASFHQVEASIVPEHTTPINTQESQEEETQTALFVSAKSHWTELEADESPVSNTSDKEPSNSTVVDQTIPELLQVLNTYILAETQEGLIIIDQHSAHERILFEKILEDMESESESGQRLLFPLTIRLSRSEYMETLALSGVFKSLGFEIEGFGGDTVIVHSVPTPHPYFDSERCFREMLQELMEGSDLTRSAKNQHEKIAMVFSCKSAIKAGQELAKEEMQELFDQLFATALPYHDVHGRPTIIRLGKGELKSKFGR